ncbi:hypothetical protein T440DRAFT_292077 [Plenodomus tracheiphilus IPT5]|uniref:Uncharacterized protein n=1 Tax=Plenodomus tracheiphilus IPT5 TaxID=1408161 RepID=A0A6A7BHI8_9PLEO|nr:hypothetical protein T440DRAFT_292077 [Plenodomus tracheiphilus IPT5]
MFSDTVCLVRHAEYSYCTVCFAPLQPTVSLVLRCETAGEWGRRAGSEKQCEAQHGRWVSRTRPGGDSQCWLAAGWQRDRGAWSRTPGLQDSRTPGHGWGHGKSRDRCSCVCRSACRGCVGAHGLLSRPPRHGPCHRGSGLVRKSERVGTRQVRSAAATERPPRVMRSNTADDWNAAHANKVGQHARCLAGPPGCCAKSSGQQAPALAHGCQRGEKFVGPPLFAVADCALASC